MVDMDIPEKAVEAVARETYRVAAEFAYETDSWDDLSDGQREAFVEDARKILEAAAPHMYAPVVEVADRLAATELTGDNYHQGRASGFRIAAEHIRQATNPYRIQT